MSATAAARISDGIESLPREATCTLFVDLMPSRLPLRPCSSLPLSFSVQFLVSEIPIPLPGLDVAFVLPPCDASTGHIGSGKEAYRRAQHFSLSDGGALPFGGSRCLGMLLAAFGAEGVLRLVECALCEAQLVFLSARSESLVPLCEALSVLLYPFVWQHCYIPVLPPQLLECVQAPLAFIVGVNSCWQGELGDVLASATIVVADSDHGTIRHTSDIPTLPTTHRAKVLRVLQRVGDQVARGSHRAPHDATPLSDADEVAVRRAFMRCYGVLLAGYAMRCCRAAARGAGFTVNS